MPKIIPTTKTLLLHWLIDINDDGNPEYVVGWYTVGYVVPPKVGLRIDHRVVLRGHLLNLPYPVHRAKLVDGGCWGDPINHPYTDLQLYCSHRRRRRLDPTDIAVAGWVRDAIGSSWWKAKGLCQTAIDSHLQRQRHSIFLRLI